MFSAFRSKAPKAPTPTVELVGYDGETLELHSESSLAVGVQNVILLNSELELERECSLSVDQAFPEKKLYWASLQADSDLSEVLKPLIPKEAEMAAAGGELPASWEEKRGQVRLQRVLGAMSPQVAGFKCVTFDINSKGLRLQLDKPLEAGTAIKVRFELEDHRLEPFDVQGKVIWCQENPVKGYWAGLLFGEITEKQREQIDKFVKETLAYEGGVLTRDYIS